MSFHDCISFIFLFLLGITRGFILTSLTTRGALDFSAFKDAFDAFSNFHQVRKSDDALPIIILKYGPCRVSINKSTSSFSKSGRCTWATNSLHHCAYPLKDSLLFWDKICSCLQFGAMSKLYLYYFKKVLARSNEDWIWLLSNFMYQLNNAPLKLS